MAIEPSLQLAEVASAVNQLGALLPSQHSGPRRMQAPERHLMVAVLHDALGCLDKYRSAKRPRDRQLFDETRQWFLAKETGWPYSFEGICAALDLDSDAVRRRLGIAPDPHTVAELRAALFQR